jgi:hypothetical protein
MSDIEIYHELWRRNPVNDGFVFWIRAAAYDFPAKTLSDAPARGVLYGYRIDETLFAERSVSSLNKRRYDLPTKTLPVRAFLLATVQVRAKQNPCLPQRPSQDIHCCRSAG